MPSDIAASIIDACTTVKNAPIPVMIHSSAPSLRCTCSRLGAARETPNNNSGKNTPNAGITIKPKALEPKRSGNPSGPQCTGIGSGTADPKSAETSALNKANVSAGASAFTTSDLITRELLDASRRAHPIPLIEPEEVEHRADDLLEHRLVDLKVDKMASSFSHE